jgi:hypothetical protein
MHLGPRISSARKLDGVGLRCVVSDFPVLNPASWVWVFRGVFISLSSSLLCSAIGFLNQSAKLSGLMQLHNV